LLISRHDCGDSISSGLPKCSLLSLQVAPNVAAGLVLKLGNWATAHLFINNIMKPAEAVWTKMLTLSFKARNELSPFYPSKLLTDVTPARALSS